MSGRRRNDGSRDQSRRDSRGGRPDPWGVGADVSGAGDAGDAYRAPDDAYMNDDYRDDAYRNAGAADQGHGTQSTPSFKPHGDTGQVYIAPPGPSAKDYEPSGYATARYDRGPGYDAGPTADYPGGGRQDPGYGRQESAYGRQESAYGPGGRYGAADYAGGYGDADHRGDGYDTAGSRAGDARDTRAAAPSFVPEFTPADADESANEGPGGVPRPIGRLSIFTLIDDKAAEFDRLAERAAEGVRAAEPDTFVFVIHVVPKAPLQRIIYEVYRDRAAFENHERQPHIQRFAADRAAYVLATNIIDLRLKYAKVAALGTPSAAEPHAQPQYQGTQSSLGPRALEKTAAAASRAAVPAAQATFTPAGDRYAGPGGQYAPANGQYAPAGEPSGQYGATGRGQYPAAGQYAGNGQYGYAGDGRYPANGNGQYPAANGYSAANGYPDANGYSAANGYSPSNGYSAANEYPGGGYSGGNGYSVSAGYRAAGGYPATNGYQGANGYPGAGGYQNGYQGTNGYPGGSGYQEPANGVYAPPAAGQYPDPAGRTQADGGGRYRELGGTPEAPAVGPGGYPEPDRNVTGGPGGSAERGRRGSRSQPDWDGPGYNDKQQR